MIKFLLKYRESEWVLFGWGNTFSEKGWGAVWRVILSLAKGVHPGQNELSQNCQGFYYSGLKNIE